MYSKNCLSKWRYAAESALNTKVIYTRLKYFFLRFTVTLVTTHLLDPTASVIMWPGCVFYSPLSTQYPIILTVDTTRYYATNHIGAVGITTACITSTLVYSGLRATKSFTLGTVTRGRALGNAGILTPHLPTGCRGQMLEDTPRPHRNLSSRLSSWRAQKGNPRNRTASRLRFPHSKQPQPTENII